VGWRSIDRRAPGALRENRGHAPPGPHPLTSAALQPTQERIDALNAEAYACRHEDTRRALALCRQASALAQSIDYVRGQAYALLRTALCEFILARDHERCKSRVQHSLTLLRSLADRAGEAEALNLLGTVHSARAEHDDATVAHRQALVLRQALNDVAGQAGSLNNLAISLRRLAHQGEAVDCLRQSLALAQQVGDVRAAGYARLNLGLVFLDQDDPEPAAEHLGQALIDVHSTTDRALECSVHTALARTRLLQGECDAAQRHLQQARVLALATGDIGDLTRVQLAWGEVEQAMGRLPAAEAQLRAALATLRRLQDREIEADTLRLLAHNLWLQNQAAPALSLLGEALALATAQAQPNVAAQVHRLASDIHEALGDPAASLRHFRAYHVLMQPQQRSQRETNRQLAAALEAAQQAERRKDEALVALERQTEQLRQLTREDGLTGVANRRWLDLQLPREYERSRRFGHAFSLAMIDIDDFKAVNDRLSHAVGDSVLRGVAQLLRHSCRGSDLVARYGGEEFVVLMAETAAADALRTAEKLRRAVQAHDWASLHPGLPAVTISIGVGSWDPAADSECTARDVLAAADRQLYLAKQGGKNRTCG